MSRRDWTEPLDPKIEGLAVQIAMDFAIDVVHVHSAQMLTASVVEGLTKAGLPVILSLHDTWWLFEHQFLMDDDGSPFLPRDDRGELYESVSKRMSVGERARRRSPLARIMRLSARRLAVSDAFAEVYRQAGIPDVGMLENGVALPQRSPSRPAPRAGGSLRIGFIGGLSAHKGLRPLEEVVRTERFENLEFVLADHRFHYGYEREAEWGGSLVACIGKAPQSRVAEVYARFDVLAAPSIWPESYGLVAREARACGVAVIAGNRGDIGRGIEPGRDGWVIDVSDDADLRHLLRHLMQIPTTGGWSRGSPKRAALKLRWTNLSSCRKRYRTRGAYRPPFEGVERQLRAPAGPFDAVEGK